MAALDADAQRALLEHGAATERIWAAWALGLRLGRAVAPHLIRSLDGSPDPGTRRHLIVMLAGMGERAVLKTVAEHDPDDLVRATACRFLARTAPPGDAAIAAFLGARLARDGAEVRQVILRSVRDRELALPPGHVAPCASEPDLDVRQLAVEVLLASAPLDWLFPGILEARIPLEPDPSLRMMLAEQCIAAGGARRLLGMARALDDARRLDLLHLLARHRQRFAWSDVAPFAAVEQPGIDAALLRLLDPADAAPAFDWLLLCTVRAVNWPQSRNRRESDMARLVMECADAAERLLPRALREMQSTPLTPAQRERIGPIIDNLDAYRQYVQGERAEDAALGLETSWYEDEAVQARLRLLESLRLLA